MKKNILNLSMGAVQMMLGSFFVFVILLVSIYFYVSSFASGGPTNIVFTSTGSFIDAGASDSQIETLVNFSHIEFTSSSPTDISGDSYDNTYSHSDIDSNNNYIIVYEDTEAEGVVCGEYQFEMYGIDSAGSSLTFDDSAMADDSGAFFMHPSCGLDEQLFQRPSVAAYDTGAIVAFYLDGSTVYSTDSGIYVGEFSKSGSTYTSGSKTKLSGTIGSATQPDIATDDDGDYVVVWAESGDIEASFNGGSAFTVNTNTSGTQRNPKVSVDRDTGNFVVVWESNHGGNYDVYYRRYNSSATAQDGSDVQVNTTVTSNDQLNAEVKYADGNFGIVWEDQNDNAIYLEVFSSSGTSAFESEIIDADTDNQYDGSTVVGGVDFAEILDLDIDYITYSATEDDIFLINYTIGQWYDSATGGLPPTLFDQERLNTYSIGYTTTGSEIYNQDLSYLTSSDEADGSAGDSYSDYKSNISVAVYSESSEAETYYLSYWDVEDGDVIYYERFNALGERVRAAATDRVLVTENLTTSENSIVQNFTISSLDSDIYHSDTSLVFSISRDDGSTTENIDTDEACSSSASSKTLANGTYYFCDAGSSGDDDLVFNITFSPSSDEYYSPRLTSFDLAWSTNAAPNAPTLVSPADATTVGATPTLSANYSDPDTGDTGTTEYRVASGSAGNCTSGSNLQDIDTDGTTTIGESSTTSDEDEDTSFTVLDALSSGTFYWCARNNDGEATSSWTSMGSIVVDATPPTISFTDEGNLPTNLSKSSVTSLSGIDVSNASGLTEYRYDFIEGTDCANDASYSSYTSYTNPISEDISGLSEGTITLCMIAKDQYDNETSSPAIRSWTKDTTAPTFTISGGNIPSESATSNVTNISGASVVDSGSDLDEIRFDYVAADNCSGASYNSFTTDLSVDEDISGLADGDITLCVIARDDIDNESSATAYSWTKDVTAPTAILSGLSTTNGGFSSQNNETITVSGVENYRYVLNPTDVSGETIGEYGGSTAIATPISLTSLAEGNYNLFVIGEDTAGNWQDVASATTLTWTYDVTAPTSTTITSPTGSGSTTSSSNIQISVNTDNGVSDYYYRVVESSASATKSVCGTLLGNYSGPVGQSTTTLFNLTSLADFVSNDYFTVCIIGEDGAGNTQSASDPSFITQQYVASGGSSTVIRSYISQIPTTTPPTPGSNENNQNEGSETSESTTPIDPETLHDEEEYKENYKIPPAYIQTRLSESQQSCTNMGSDLLSLDCEDTANFFYSFDVPVLLDFGEFYLITLDLLGTNDVSDVYIDVPDITKELSYETSNGRYTLPVLIYEEEIFERKLYNIDFGIKSGTNAVQIKNLEINKVSLPEIPVTNRIFGSLMTDKSDSSFSYITSILPVDISNSQPFALLLESEEGIVPGVFSKSPDVISVSLINRNLNEFGLSTYSEDRISDKLYLNKKTGFVWVDESSPDRVLNRLSNGYIDLFSDAPTKFAYQKTNQNAELEIAYMVVNYKSSDKLNLELVLNLDGDFYTFNIEEVDFSLRSFNPQIEKIDDTTFRVPRIRNVFSLIKDDSQPKKLRLNIGNIIRSANLEAESIKLESLSTNTEEMQIQLEIE